MALSFTNLNREDELRRKKIEDEQRQRLRTNKALHNTAVSATPTSPLTGSTERGTSVSMFRDKSGTMTVNARGRPQPGRAIIDETAPVQQPTTPLQTQPTQRQDDQFGDQMIMHNGRALHIPAPGTTTRFKRRATQRQQQIAQRTADKKALMGGGIGADPRRVVSSGAMIKGQRQAAKEQQFVQGYQDAGGQAVERVREAMGKGGKHGGESDAAAQAEQQRQKDVQTLTGRFMHSVTNFRPEKAVQYLEAWFDNGLTEDDMTPEMHQLYLDWADDGTINAMVDAENQLKQKGLESQQDRDYTLQQREREGQRFQQGQADRAQKQIAGQMDRFRTDYDEAVAQRNEGGVIAAAQGAIGAAAQMGQRGPEWAEAVVASQTGAGVVNEALSGAMPNINMGAATPTMPWTAEAQDKQLEAAQKKAEAEAEKKQKYAAGALKNIKAEGDFEKIVKHLQDKGYTEEELMAVPEYQRIRSAMEAGVPYLDEPKGLTYEQQKSFMREAEDLLGEKTVPVRDSEGKTTGSQVIQEAATEHLSVEDYGPLIPPVRALSIMYSGDSKKHQGLAKVWRDFDGTMKARGVPEKERKALWMATLHATSSDYVDAWLVHAKGDVWRKEVEKIKKRPVTNKQTQNQSGAPGQINDPTKAADAFIAIEE